MPFHLMHFQLSERQGVFAVLFVAFILAGCTVDFAAVTSVRGDSRQTNVGSILCYGLAGGGFFMSVGQFSPTFQRLAIAMTLSVGAFFMGNLSPQVFPSGLADGGSLFVDIPNVLLFTLICVASLLVVFNILLRPGNPGAGLDDSSVRPWDGVFDRRSEKNSAVAPESFSRSIDYLELSQNALVVFNADGVILELNREAEIMFGWTRAQLVGQPVEVLIPDSEFASHPEKSLAFVRVLANRTGASEQIKRNGVRKNGMPFPVEISSNPGRSGGAYAVVATIRAVTERGPSSGSGALQRSEFALNHGPDIAGPQLPGQQRHALCASLERRLTSLIDGSAQILKVATREHSNTVSDAKTWPPFEFSEDSFDDTLADLADRQWADRWASAEKDVRASAYSLLRVIDDMQRFPDIDSRKTELYVSSTAPKHGVEDLCDRLFPTSKIKSR